MPLPKAPTVEQVDPATLCGLIIGEPKVGKTTFLASNPDALFLCFEAGHKFIKAHKFVITGWDKTRGRESKYNGTDEHGTFMEAIELLENSKRFKTLVIDTADMAAKMCMDFFAKKKGVEHISDIGEWGKGWEVGLATPFRQAFLRLQATGRGVWSTTHSAKEVARYATGEQARKETSLPKGAFKVLATQADLIMHFTMGKKRKGRKHRDRILVCGSDPDILAGNRASATIPERYIVRDHDQWQQFTEFFTSPEAADKASKLYEKIYN
jgi:hypothetical protein